MRTSLRQEHVTEIVRQWIANNGGGEVNFLYYSVANDGGFDGCLVDHDYEFKLPCVEEDAP